MKLFFLLVFFSLSSSILLVRGCEQFVETWVEADWAYVGELKDTFPNFENCLKGVVKNCKTVDCEEDKVWFCNKAFEE